MCTNDVIFSGGCENIYGENMACETFAQYRTVNFYVPADNGFFTGGCVVNNTNPSAQFTEARSGPDSCVLP